MNLAICNFIFSIFNKWPWLFIVISITRIIVPLTSLYNLSYILFALFPCIVNAYTLVYIIFSPLLSKLMRPDVFFRLVTVHIFINTLATNSNHSIINIIFTVQGIFNNLIYFIFKLRQLFYLSHL